ncbi:hypothetical protein [Nostoc sp. FACHB-110]|uniref:hypothetical protein n=1 Tax=Nostoc sp. FACHB-110 TaxID=2692834 RepID=UPI00168291AD|nr:hypothetical protein [Nostoc sp. FACHB-110]MBD2438441.1 hypothetical protein [Nostoc sp. FACHB-110]
MGGTSRYWRILRINLADKIGYKQYVVAQAQDFLQRRVEYYQNADIQAALLSDFYANQSRIDEINRAKAGLCLRCYVSDSIVKACQKIDNLFGGDKSFSYHDLLPFVLNDDGETLVILDSDRSHQLIVDEKGKVQPTAYKFFTVEVLRKYQPNVQTSMSLDNWAYLQTKQNPELKDFLSEFGFQLLSDWALLNRARPKQIESLSGRDRYLVEVFHAVYRRDRRKSKQVQVKRCPDPSHAQLQEMLTLLQQRGVIITTQEKLKREIEQVAKQLRQYDIWTHREPLEYQDQETGNYTLRADIPTDYFNEIDVERLEITEFLYEQLSVVLTESIEQEIQNNIQRLENSKRYAPLSAKYIPGLQLYYCQCKSLKEIFPLLEMTSWDQARRILNPGELLNKVRTQTVQKLLESILNLAHEKGLTKMPPEPDYLKALAEQIEKFADEEVFQEAGEEIRAGKSRALESLYAQKIRSFLAETTVLSQTYSK